MSVSVPSVTVKVVVILEKASVAGEPVLKVTRPRVVEALCMCVVVTLWVLFIEVKVTRPVATEPRIHEEIQNWATIRRSNSRGILLNWQIHYIR